MTDETDDLTVEALFDFYSDQTEVEADQFREHEGIDEIPQHAETLVMEDATELLKTVTSMEMAYEMADDEDDVAEEEVTEDVAHQTAVLIGTIGKFAHERDVDVVGAIKDRIDFITDYQDFVEAMNEAEGEDERFEAVDEYLTDELAEELGVQMGGTSVGDNVDREDYEPSGVDRTFQ